MLSPLARALPAMTALQATVALGMFALSVLAPQLGLSVTELAALNTLMFGVGTVGALFAGRLLARFGDWHVAAACAGAVALGMACLLAGFPLAAWVAVLCFGLAFGPETPASASVLTRLTTPSQRPWVFSIRQTGNQIGAMAGSLLLPVLLVREPRLPFLVVGLVAAAMTVWCLTLHRTESRAHSAKPATDGLSIERSTLSRVLGSAPLRALCFATLCYTAVQMCLNTFLMSLAVQEWRLDTSAAAGRVALLQAAGLVGRLFWGWVARSMPDAARLLGWIGVSIAIAGTALMAWPGASASAMAPILVAVLGFTASGWNGVLVAEVSRIGGPRDAGALTGVVLTFGYVGLALVPLLFAAVSVPTSIATAFAALFLTTVIAAVALLWTRPAASAA